MANLLRRQSLTLPLAPAIAGVAGLLVAAAVLLTPVAMLETLVVDSGVSAIASAAVPPLGRKAHAAIAFVIGGGVALVAWFGLFLLFGNRSLVVQRASTAAASDRAPSVRRADAHPDAPPRRPFSVSQDVADGAPAVAELPLPMTVEKSEADAPAWLEPAILATPQSAPASPDSDTMDRIETFELTAMVRDDDAAIVEARRFVERGADRRRGWALPSLVEPVGSAAASLPMGTPTPPAPVSNPPAPQTIGMPDGIVPPRPAGATIEQLIARLERGVERPAAAIEPTPLPVALVPPAPKAILPQIDTLEQTLETLRRLSRRVG